MQTLEQRIIAQLKREPATFIDLCKLFGSKTVTYGMLDYEMECLAHSEQIRYNHALAAWVA